MFETSFPGMDKILQSVGSRDGGISVTNDGATILRSIHVDNAAAKVLVNIAKTQASPIPPPFTIVYILLSVCPPHVDGPVLSVLFLQSSLTELWEHDDLILEVS